VLDPRTGEASDLQEPELRAGVRVRGAGVRGAAPA
jgi:hypothetical protein